MNRQPLANVVRLSALLFFAALVVPACGGGGDDGGGILAGDEDDITKRATCGGPSDAKCPASRVCVDDPVTYFNSGTCINPGTTTTSLPGYGCADGFARVTDPRDRTRACLGEGSCAGFCLAKPAGSKTAPGKGEKCGGKAGIKCAAGLRCVDSSSSCKDCMGTCRP